MDYPGGPNIISMVLRSDVMQKNFDRPLLALKVEGGHTRQLLGGGKGGWGLLLEPPDGNAMQPLLVP